jgi:hypothetical protein
MKGAAAMKGRVWTAEERQKKRATALRLNLAQYGVPGGGRRLWTKEEMALLGLPDAAIARRIGRTVDAVRQKRQKLGIANPVDRRKKKNKPTR